jgi:inhibitor of KinA
MSNSTCHIYPCGDHAVTIELGNEINIAINQKIIFLFRYLKELNIYGVRDVIPAYHTLTLVYDLALLKKQNPKDSVYEGMKAHLQKAFELMKDASAVATKLVEIPVCYDASLAPDIVSLAAMHELSVEEVVKLHTEKTYRVYMTGFLPGFAYMGTVDDKINTPRKQQPRTLVPAGSIGIAGEQTGIYPFDSPGGWQLIGQTPVTMFDAKREEPSFLKAGDEVRFYAVTLTEFTKLKKP